MSPLRNALAGKIAIRVKQQGRCSSVIRITQNAAGSATKWTKQMGVERWEQ
jgi:hypothetical protein